MTVQRTGLAFVKHFKPESRLGGCLLYAFNNVTSQGLPRSGFGYGPADIFQLEWIDACKGKNNNVVHGTSSKTHCDFDYSGAMIEQMLLGLVAHRAGKKLEYDPASGRIMNAPEANDYLKREYRPNWTLNG
jgi:hypothetical protein